MSELFTPIYDEFMLMGFKEETQVGTQIFNEIDDTTKDHKFDGISGTGEWEAANELAGGGYEDLVLAYVNTITPLKYWKKIKVSFEATDQDEYAMLKKKCVDAQQIGKGGRVKVEKLRAAVLINGLTTAGPDGQILFSNSHPKNRIETGVTYDNLLAGPLSHDNLELAEQQMAANYFDMKGLPIEVSENPQIVYPPALKGVANRLLSDRADYRPGPTTGHSEMEINRFAGRYNPLCWRYLSAALGGSDTAWYILFKEVGFLEMVWSARPSFDSWIDKDIEAYIFKGRLMAAASANDWRCGFASTGL
ncbi:MAG: hypothetical protein WC810_03030 [Janthinobacterium sp.]